MLDNLTPTDPLQSALGGFELVPTNPMQGTLGNLPLVPIKTPGNRHEKRKAQREMDRFLPSLSGPVNDFIAELRSNTEKTYKEIYKIHLGTFEAGVRYCERQQRAEFVAIDKEFFSNHFKPLENV